MQFDAMDWVFNPPKPPKEDPTLAYGLAECIGPGDCYADGALRTDNGHRIMGGRVWLFEDKLANAAYYGWRQTGLVTVDHRGRALHLVSR